jgi:hypothetical protein
MFALIESVDDVAASAEAGAANATAAATAARMVVWGFMEGSYPSAQIRTRLSTPGFGTPEKRGSTADDTRK